MIETSLKTYLDNLTHKVTYLKKPQSDDSCIVMKQISYKPIKYHGGNLFERYRFQIDVYDTTFALCRTTALSIIDNLDGNVTNFKMAFLEDDRYEELSEGCWVSYLDFYIFN